MYMQIKNNSNNLNQSHTLRVFEVLPPKKNFDGVQVTLGNLFPLNFCSREDKASTDVGHIMHNLL